MRICELKQKEVINICSCNRLGFVQDLEVDICKGIIIAIIVPGPAKFCGLFGKSSEYVIPYRCIKQVGEDIILVQIKEEDYLKQI